MKIAFQGEPGAYSEEAVLEHFPDQKVGTIPCAAFSRVFEAVQTGDCDLGFVPIENSVAGSIYQVYDLLSNHSLWVIGEHYLRVRHCLIASPGTNLDQITKVISHPQAIMQTEKNLYRLTQAQVESFYDTAGSVKFVKESGTPGLAAIASRRAAQIYGMTILAENLEDDLANFTRFLIIARSSIHPQKPAKTSIVFTLKNEPGALFKMMSVFALRGIDLTKIDSRPLVGTPWDYLFYLDFCGAAHDTIVMRALSHLDEFALTLRVFGSYPDQRHQITLSK